MASFPLANTTRAPCLSSPWPSKVTLATGLKFQFVNVGARLGDPTLVSTSVISREHSDMLLCECASSEMTGSGHGKAGGMFDDESMMSPTIRGGV